MAIQVGFARQVMTPDFPCWLAGGGYPKRIFTDILEDIYAHCVAITDETGNTALIFALDIISTGAPITNALRETAGEAAGVPVDHIFCSAIHTHSAPGFMEGREGAAQFRQLLMSAVAQAAKAAMEDRAPATASVGETQAKGMTFVRRYKLADGTIEGASGNFTTCKERVAHAYDSDETVQIIRFTRQGKKDILLTNLGAHSTFNGATHLTNLSADFGSAVRDHIEANTDCLVAHFMSAAGDQTPTTRMKSDDHGLNYREYGDRIGQLIVAALPELKEVNTGNIAVKYDECTLKTNQSDMHRLEDAKRIWAMFQEEGFAKTTPVAHAEGFASVYEAMAITNHARLPDTKTIGIEVMTLGDISFAFASYEMYSQNGRFIRENGPYQINFVATCANGSNGYLPSDMGYEINCYEAYASNVARGSGEKLAELFVKMLTELKEK